MADRSDGNGLAALCADVMACGDRVADVITHRLSRPFAMSLHRHPRRLQLDLLVGAGGWAEIGDRRWPLAGLSAICVYPGLPHRYALEPCEGQVEVHHVKLRGAAACGLAEGRPLPAVCAGLPSQTGLIAAMRAVTRLGLSIQPPPLLMRAKLCESLSLWPRGEGQAGPGGAGEAGDSDRWLSDAVLREAILAEAEGRERAALPGVFALIEHRLDDPPSLEELASAAHLSVRHFTRRFRSAVGCSPHAFVTARRLDRARHLLLERDGPLEEVAQAMGFGSLPGFSRWFSQNAGLSPSAFRRRGAEL